MDVQVLIIGLPRMAPAECGQVVSLVQVSYEAHRRRPCAMMVVPGRLDHRLLALSTRVDDRWGRDHVAERQRAWQMQRSRMVCEAWPRIQRVPLK